MLAEPAARAEESEERGELGASTAAGMLKEAAEAGSSWAWASRAVQAVAAVEEE